MYNREEEEKSDDLPHLQKIAHMQAAGWGGMGLVINRSERSNWNTSSVNAPQIMYSIGRRSNNWAAGNSGVDTLDIPAFLRRQVDDFETESYTRASLMSRLEQLLDMVNKRLTHPEDIPKLIRAIKVYQEKLHPLFNLVDEIKMETSSLEDAWIAFIAWADQQVGPGHQLTKHAARAMRVLVGAIPENSLTAMMALLYAQMEKLSSDGWPQRAGPAGSQVGAIDKLESITPD